MKQGQSVGRAVRSGPLLAIATLWACGASILGNDPDTGLALLVTRGPIQPVAQEGEANEAPVDRAAVRVRGAAGGGSVEVRTDAEGAARVVLLPGDYVVTVTECPGSLVLPAEARVTVLEGAIVSLALSCDTGIR